MEKNLEDNLKSLATQLVPIYKQHAPLAYQNQWNMKMLHENVSLAARIVFPSLASLLAWTSLPNPTETFTT